MIVSSISSRQHPFWSLAISFALACVFLSGCSTTNSLAEAAANSVTLRVMTYNIQHGAGADGKVDLLRLSEAIKKESPDIVALEEVDRGVARTDKRDLPAELSALTGLQYYYFNNNHRFQGGEYGNAVLSRLPILQSTNTHYKMLRPDEQRGVLQSIIDVHGRKVLFMVTHIDYHPGDAERLMNVGEIQQLVRQYPAMPVFICGDFNVKPDSPVYGKMNETFDDTWKRIGRGDGPTYPSILPRSRIDYIWIGRNLDIEPVKAWVPQTQASDHLPLVADFLLK